MSVFAPAASGAVVTGEAVALDLRLARLPSRTLALVLDVLVQLAGLVGLTLIAARLFAGAEPALAAAVELVLTVAVLVGYPVLSETLWRGRTVGKAALGLRVVRDDGGPVRFRHALVRGLLEVFVDLWFTVGVVGLITAAVSGRGKRVGDLLAGTVVVRERAPRGSAPPPAMPPALAGWAAGADLSRVGDDLALATRQMLGRSGELAPAAYDELTRRLAARIAAVVFPPPPPGTPAASYLAAVLAERRRRDEARLAGLGPGPAAAAPAGVGTPDVRSASPPPEPADGGFAPPG